MQSLKIMTATKLLFLMAAVAFLLTGSSCSSGLKIGETCSLGEKDECEAGLRCQRTCDGNSEPRYMQIVRPESPTSKVKGLPFNKYSWLTTHNSFARRGLKYSAMGSEIISPTNQDDSITSQLSNGVRGLMLDMYDFNDGVWLCHSFGGQCLNATSFDPAINVLKEIRVFMEQNPTEIVTIFVEDYVKAPHGLSKVFEASGLSKYWFPVWRMPKNGEDWPTVDDMVKQNQRLVVFTSKHAKEASEGIAYEWNYVVENQYGDESMSTTSRCSNRAESSPMNATTRSLVLQNYFPTNPDPDTACRDNSASLLISMMKTCQLATGGNRWPNFIAVDFYQMMSEAAAEATDIANGQLICGCKHIAYCKVNAPFGTCDVPKPQPPPLPPGGRLSRVGGRRGGSFDYLPSRSSSDGRDHHLHWIIATLFATLLLLIW